MMLFMNDYDLAYARRRFGHGQTPNRLALVMVVDALREWTNEHTDGWAYWPKPARAARNAMLLIRSTTNDANDRQEAHDITDEEMRTAVRPIKAFLTRHNVSSDDREVILRSTVEV